MNIDNIEFVITGKLIKVASIKDELWIEKHFTQKEIDALLQEIKHRKLKAAIFTFCQDLPDTQPKFNYPMEWDNFAAIEISTYDNWWMKKLPQVTRKSVRRGYKRGVEVRVSEFDDKLVEGIVNIYNETPVRQGRKFPHYGADFDYVKKGNASYLNSSDFICAYHQETLIGFIKLVYIGSVAQIMQIISMNKHQDKRTTNILIAKAVEICVEKKMRYFIYGKYIYGNKGESPITIFKERNGFEMIQYPRYYIPLSAVGKLAVKFKLYQGLDSFIPKKLLIFLLNLRARWYQKQYQPEQDDAE